MAGHPTPYILIKFDEPIYPSTSAGGTVRESHSTQSLPTDRMAGVPPVRRSRSQAQRPSKATRRETSGPDSPFRRPSGIILLRLLPFFLHILLHALVRMSVPLAHALSFSHRRTVCRSYGGRGGVTLLPSRLRLSSRPTALAKPRSWRLQVTGGDPNRLPSQPFFRHSSPRCFQRFSAVASSFVNGATTERDVSSPRQSSLVTASDTFDNNDSDDDTIFALSSGSSSSVATAVAVIRISGPRVKSHVIPGLLSPRTAQRLLNHPRTAVLATLQDPTTNQPLDQSLLLYFPSPRSFTGQDVLELHVHGSRAVVRDVCDVLQQSALKLRYAEPGEFTQRAYAHGKLDVLQVEALADLLCSDTLYQRQQALKQLDGTLSHSYTMWRDTLIAGLAHAEAVIDFGDDEQLLDDNNDDNDDDEHAHDDNGHPAVNDGGMAVWGNVVDKMRVLQRDMERQLGNARRGELVRDGVKVAVVGPVNAGKSSLFNVLAQRDAAIVSSQAGTTRDILEVALDLGGVKCVLQDTAGIRTTATDAVEQEGIRRAAQAAATADVVVAVVDAAAAAIEDEGSSSDQESVQIALQQILAEKEESSDGGVGEGSSVASAAVRPTPVLLVLNKVDLTTSNATAHSSTNHHLVSSLNDAIFATNRTTVSKRLNSRLVSAGAFEISCRTQQGLDEFIQHLTTTVLERVSPSEASDAAAQEESVLITRTRHRQHVSAAVACLERFHDLARHGSPAVDMAAEELRLAASELGRVTGAVDVEDVLDRLFADFCIGK